MAEMQPAYPPSDLNDIILQLTASPNCKKYNCHGRGYLGIRANQDGSKTVILCSCARYGETDYVRAMKRLDKLELMAGALLSKEQSNAALLLMSLDRAAECGLLHLLKCTWREIFRQKARSLEVKGTVDAGPLNEPKPTAEVAHAN